MIRNLISLAIFVAALTLSACGNGSEFVGKWQNVNKKTDAIEIVRNGSDFLVLRKSENLMTGKMETSKIPLQYKDNTLKLDMGFLSATLSYIKATDSLAMASVMGAEEYKRAK